MFTLTEEAAPETAIELTAGQFDVAKFNAVLTLTSPTTGEHRTFRVRTVSGGPLEGQRLIELLIGSDNENDYKAFATVGNELTRWCPEGEIRCWKRFKGASEPSEYERFCDLLARPAYWSGRGVRYQISANCRRCNRALTHPESLDHGYGPVCWDKVNGG